MKKQKNNGQGITPEQVDLWQTELIEQARDDKKKAERFLVVSLAVNVILAAVVLFR